MINTKNRFRGRGSLNFIYRRGKTVRLSQLALKYTAARQEDYRLAVVVSKKVSKSAVVRNRIRRRLYEAARTIKKDSGAVWPYDLVLSVYAEDYATMPSQKLQKDVESLLKKAGLKTQKL